MAWLNVYQSGYYHRLGKPRQYNCHPGDLYPSEQEAIEDIDPEARHLYKGTFEVLIPAEVLGPCNAPDSVPTPLSQTRRELAAANVRRLYAETAKPVFKAPSHIEGMRPLVKAVEDWPLNGSLETSEAEAVQLTTEQIVGRWGSGEEGR